MQQQLRTFYPAFIMERVDPDFCARIARRFRAALVAVDGVKLERLSELHKVNNIEHCGTFCFAIAAPNYDAAASVAAQIESAVYLEQEKPQSGVEEVMQWQR